MILKIISLICVALVSFSVGAFIAFVVFKLRKIDSQTDGTLNPKNYWSMGIYMDDIPQNEQNTANIVSVPLKIYDKSEYSDIIVPRKGEEISGIYGIGENRFEMTGIVKSVFYNTDIDLIIVECKCTDIYRLSNSLI